MALFPPGSVKYNQPAPTAEVKEISRLLSELEDCNLTNWETGFVADLQDKIKLYEGGAYITEKQGDWLNRLAEKYGLAPA